MKFEFATATRVIFTAGAFREVGRLAAAHGRHALVVGGSTKRSAPLIELLEAAGLAVTTFAVSGEPTVELIEDGVAQARAADCDVVVGMGGGSVLDTGKAIAALLANTGNVLDYLEVIGRGQSLTQPSTPYIAIPTTAGTGSEVTRNAVLAAPEQQVKVSLRSPFMLPRIALIDPELTYSMPPEITASTGLDALTQCIEPYVSPQANPLTDSVCREGVARAALALPRAFLDGDDATARTDMCLTSLCGGLALANARLGAVHGFAAPLGGMFPVPHGMACARLLPFVMEANVRALQEREPANPALARYHEIGRLLTGDPEASANDGVVFVQALCAELRVPSLGSYGVTPAQVPDVVAKAQQASSMQGNPITLTVDELSDILLRSIGEAM